jgi:mono/diheme cytochrome c family protein
MRADLRRGMLAVLAVSVLGLGGCTVMEDMMSSVPVLNFMRSSPAFDPFEAPRPAPEGSVPYRSPAERWEPVFQPTEALLTAWGDTLSNPMPMSEGVLTRGALVFETYCAVCHGPEGRGDGPLVGPGLFPFATDLTGAATAGRTDGYLYAVTRLGRGLMPPYRRVPVSDRWAVVNYVRQLQQAEGAEPAPAAEVDEDDAAAPAAQPTVQGQE